MKDLNKFPSLEQVKKSIDNLNKIEWPKFNPDEDVNDYLKRVSKVFTEEFNILPDVMEFIKRNEFGFKIFRVRELSSFNNIDLVCEHSYSPIHLTTKLNRCNYPKHPIFYASNYAMTALAEVIKNDNYKKRKYCISRWKIHPSEEELLIQPYLFGDIHEVNPFKVLKDSMNDKLSGIFDDKLTPDQVAGMKLYLKYMADTFMNDKNYNLSAFFAHRRLYAPHNFRTEILIYPSIQTGLKGVNMAIHPNFVDSNMYPARFYIIEIDNFENETINFSFLKYGIMERSHISWKDVHPEDKYYTNIIKEDFESEGEFELIQD